MVRLLPYLEYKASDKHLLAHPLIWAERRLLLLRESHYYHHLKATVHKSFCTRMGLMFRLKIRNNHPVFSLWLRNTGTNFTAHQRLVCVLSSLATCLAVNALFYGATFKTPISESATSLFVTIVAAIVPLLGKVLFQEHKFNFHDQSTRTNVI